MNVMIKLAYPIIIAIIIMPTIEQWNAPLQIKQKQSFLPPELPKIPTKNDAQLSALLSTDLWDKERQKITPQDSSAANASIEQADNQKWRLKGIGIQQNQAAAVITSDKETNSYYQGDTLPDGAKVIKININNIVIERAGETHNVYLFK